MMTQTHLSPLKQLVLKAVQAADFEAHADDIHLERAKTPEHGHFTTNIAMLVAGKAGTNPRDAAEAIAAHLSSPPVARAEVAGPGFINLWIEQKFYTDQCGLLIKDIDAYLHAAILKQRLRRMVIEYSSPNIAKPLGVHHLLSTCIGEALKRIFKAYGYEVIAENYPGDIGTQFGKLITAIRQWGDEAVIRKHPIDELLKLYVRFHEEAERDPTLEDRGREAYKAFEEGDPEARALWKKIVDWSMAEVQPLYDRLGVSFDGVHGESFFEDKMPAILKEGRGKGVFVDGENGAWIVMPDDPNDPPALIKKSDGATLYLTRDLAQMDFFEKTYHPDTIAWVVDVAQSLYFRQRFHAWRKLRNTGTELVHVVFGRMDFKGKSMSTRKGNVVRMNELLDEAEARALRLVQERTEGLSHDEQSVLARIMGIGAIKYNILSQNRAHNMTFDWDVMLALEGNSAPYLMYTGARAKSILRKGQVDPKAVRQMQLELADDRETQVALDLAMYPAALERAAEEYKPSHIAHYLYQLARNFNTLYNALPVLQADTAAAKNTRLMLTAGVARVMEHGMGLLGIEVPVVM